MPLWVVSLCLGVWCLGSGALCEDGVLAGWEGGEWAWRILPDFSDCLRREDSYLVFFLFPGYLKYSLLMLGWTFKTIEGVLTIMKMEKEDLFMDSSREMHCDSQVPCKWWINNLKRPVMGLTTGLINGRQIAAAEKICISFTDCIVSCFLSH